VKGLVKTAIGISFYYPVDSMVELATNVERLGYDSFWMHEDPRVGDSLMVLSSIAAKTRRMRIGSACVSAVTRHPAMTAASAATLHVQSGGRFVLGFGLGGFPWLPNMGVNVFPVAETKPLQRLRESIAVIRSLLAGEPVTLAGRFYRLDGFRLFTKPDGQVPIYLASYGLKTLGEAASFADGVITSPGVHTVEDVKRFISAVKSGEDRYGRRIEKASYLLASVSKLESEAAAAVKRVPFFLYMLAEVVAPESLEKLGVDTKDLPKIRGLFRRHNFPEAASLVSDEMAQALTITGTADQCLDRLKEYVEVGVDLAIITPVGEIQACLETFRPDD